LLGPRPFLERPQIRQLKRPVFACSGRPVISLGNKGDSVVLTTDCTHIVATCAQAVPEISFLNIATRNLDNRGLRAVAFQNQMAIRPSTFENQLDPVLVAFRAIGQLIRNANGGLIARNGFEYHRQRTAERAKKKVVFAPTADCLAQAQCQYETQKLRVRLIDSGIHMDTTHSCSPFVFDPSQST